VTWPAFLALIGVGAAALTLAILLWRSRDAWPALPDWAWADIRRLFALVATVAGAAILTALAWEVMSDRQALLVGIVNLLAKGSNNPDRLAPIAQTLAEDNGWGLKLLLSGVLMIILSLGFVMGRRQFRGKTLGGTEVEYVGGDDDQVAKAAKDVAGAAADKADEIESELKP